MEENISLAERIRRQRASTGTKPVDKPQLKPDTVEVLEEDLPWETGLVDVPKKEKCDEPIATLGTVEQVIEKPGTKAKSVPKKVPAKATAKTKVSPKAKSTKPKASSKKPPAKSKAKTK